MHRPGFRMYSSAQSLTDPPGSSVIASAVAWVEGAALGSVATAIATIAVAATGSLLLSGRPALRGGIPVMSGCFRPFGAPGARKSVVQGKSLSVRVYLGGRPTIKK